MRHNGIYRPAVMMIAGLAIAALACNLNLTATEEPLPPPAEESQPEIEPEISDGGAVSTLEDVRQAVIQIEAQGTFVDPEVGLQVNSAGRGSGFIIDSSRDCSHQQSRGDGSGLTKGLGWGRE